MDKKLFFKAPKVVLTDEENGIRIKLPGSKWKLRRDDKGNTFFDYGKMYSFVCYGEEIDFIPKIEEHIEKELKIAVEQQFPKYQTIISSVKTLHIKEFAIIEIIYNVDMEKVIKKIKEETWQALKFQEFNFTEYLQGYERKDLIAIGFPVKKRVIYFQQVLPLPPELIKPYPNEARMHIYILVRNLEVL